MHFTLLWRVISTRPTTILTITKTNAALKALGSDSTEQVLLTPLPYLLDSGDNLTAPFQLRTFLDLQLLPTHKKPFSIIVALPAEAQDPQRLATQIIAVLMQLRLPPYVVTTKDPTIGPATQLPCLFSGRAYGRPLPWRLALATLLLAITTGVSYWYQQKPPLQESLPIVPKPTRPKPRIPGLVYQPIVAALMAHQPACQLTSLTAKPSETTAAFTASNPASLAIVQKMFGLATKSTWGKTAPRYRPGLPPMYVSKITGRHLFLDSASDYGHTELYD
ncbi:MAG: hypothetical protein QG632_32 [Candidatus Dependentiae bacterium]|nr:hypothetical protein [Candidatus Dependentiae bacterium]